MDRVLLSIILLLILIGIVALFSASLPESKDKLGNIYGFFTRQVTQGLFLGVIAGIIFYRMSLKRLKKLAAPLFILSLLLMLLVFIPGLGVSSGGSSRWLDVGLFVFQPSEMLKLGLIIYLAAWISS